MTTEMEKVRDRLLASLLIERRGLELADRYVEEEQPLKFLSPVLQSELGDRVAPIIVSIPRYAVDVYDQRLDIRDFALPHTEKKDQGLAREMWDWFDANDGPFLSQQGHYEGLALGRAYALVGPNPDDTANPILTVESPFDCIHEVDAGRQVKYGLKEFYDDKVRFVSLYHPNGRITWRRDRTEWIEDETEDNDFGLCRLQPLMPQQRILGRARRRRLDSRLVDQRLGRPIFQSILTIVDAINKSAYDMMVSSEFHGLPRRWATGLQATDFVDPVTDKPIDTFSLIAGRMWGTESEKAKFGQFAEADLGNFHNTIKLLFQVTATLLGLPADYLGFQGESNPTSADAIRASEAQLVKRAERMQTSLSPAWARVQRLRALTAGEQDDPRLQLVSPTWRSAATPTRAQEIDAAIKALGARDSQGRSLIPMKFLRKDLGYSQPERDEMDEMDRDALADPYLDRASRPVKPAPEPAKDPVADPAGGR